MSSPPGAYPYVLPFTLGHETAGRVAALGPARRASPQGDPVVVYSRWGCGSLLAMRQRARQRLRAHPARPSRRRPGTRRRPGGVSPRARRRATSCPRRDSILSPRRPLTDAALTSYHAVKLSLAQLRPGSTALVLGVGGLGHMAIQILKAISPARIVAVDVRSPALELAREAGADAVLVRRRPDARRACAPRSAPTGRPSRSTSSATTRRWRWPPDRSRRAAIVAFVGRGGGELRVAPGLIPYECTVRMPTWGTLAELAEVVALARSGAIHSEARGLRPRRGGRRLRPAPAGRGAGRAPSSARREVGRPCIASAP